MLIMDLEQLQERSTKLELLLSHLQHDYDQLSIVVREQNQKIEELERTVKKLIDQIETGSTELPDPLDEKPPHY